MVQGCEELADGLIVAADFDPERSLTDGRETLGSLEIAGDLLLPAHPVNPGCRQNDGIVAALAHFAQAGIQITAKVFDNEIRSQTSQLRRPAQAAGAYQRPLGQLGKLAAIATDQHIPGIFPLGDGSYREPIRQHRRDILHAVDRQIHGTIQQSVFQFLDKESLAADLGERHIEDLITGGLDDSQLDPTTWPPPFEFGLHPLALRQRQQAAAGPNAQQSVH